MPKILLIEDDIGISTPLSLYIKEAGNDIVLCQNGNEAFGIFEKERPNIIILDINLPWKNGIEVCREIRWVSEVPIIVLSARESEDDKVTLFDLWADDYVSKPFSPRELIARINAVIKRTTKALEKQKWNTKMIEFGTLKIDIKNFTVVKWWYEVRLTKTEFLILEYFVKNSKNLIKREALMKDIIWYENYIYDRTIDTHVKNLRKKLEWWMEIETVRGIWYRVNPIN